jgi:hypothetical protein
LVYQATNEIVNGFQERRTALAPLLGGVAGIMTLGLTILSRPINMEFRTVKYHATKPDEESLWKNQGVAHRLWKATTLGGFAGALSAAIAGYWYDYPKLKPTDGYRTAAWGSIKLTSKVAFAFASASLVYQATNEIVNGFQERRTALAPLLGGVAGIMTLGLTTKYIKTSLAMGLVAGVGAAMLGHAPPLAASMHYRESRYDGAAASQKFRYLKSLEHREAREAARLAELDALREFQD